MLQAMTLWLLKTPYNRRHKLSSSLQTRSRPTHYRGPYFWRMWLLLQLPVVLWGAHEEWCDSQKNLCLGEIQTVVFCVVFSLDRGSDCRISHWEPPTSWKGLGFLEELVNLKGGSHDLPPDANLSVGCGEKASSALWKPEEGCGSTPDVGDYGRTGRWSFWEGL